ncbi:MAG: cupin domain-containing protein [Spirochaetales bacterium]|nr:cupin domain-containing protein [Spirochaetales bacterium]
MRIGEETAISAAAGEIPKIIEEYIGLVSTGTDEVSIARMKSPAGWSAPGQKREFAEYTVVLTGKLTVETKDESRVVEAGQAVIVPAGEWVQYSSPDEQGAEYIAVCLPAFSPDRANRK